jgi:hypothetical protein
MRLNTDIIGRASLFHISDHHAGLVGKSQLLGKLFRYFLSIYSEIST